MNLNLSRRETAVLKGAAILAIMLHNYCHWLWFTVKENEYTYQYKWVYYLWEHVRRLDTHLPLDLLSYFGHYGVPVFVFLSGYGVACKYGGGPGAGAVPLWRFVRYNVLKFWKLMLPAWVLFMVVDTCFVAGRFRFTLPDLLGQLTFVVNLFPYPGTHIHPGPFWYFGLTLQLYLLYRLMLWRTGRTGLLLTAAASLLGQTALLAAGGVWPTDVLEYVRYNFVGALPPFCMGLYAARFGCPLPASRRGCACTALLLLALMVWGGNSWYTWPWVPVCCVGTAVCGLRALPLAALRPVEWVGAISASAFVLHPLWRPLWLAWGGADHVQAGLWGYVASVLLSAWIYHRLMGRLPAPRL